MSDHVSCVFCDIIRKKLPAFVIYEDEKYVAFLDRYPIDTGHSLIIPKDHHPRITDMNTSDVGELFSRAPRIARAIMRATGAVAFSIGQNNGAEARQVIFHVHVHIIPRYKDRGAVWAERAPATDTELSVLRDRIASEMAL